MCIIFEIGLHAVLAAGGSFLSACFNLSGLLKLKNSRSQNEEPMKNMFPLEKKKTYEILELGSITLE